MTQQECISTRWTLQQFGLVAGRPWFSLQEENDSGPTRRFTGYRQEMNALAARLGIVPEELEMIEEQQFYQRCAEE
jgi:hypothetical protein